MIHELDPQIFENMAAVQKFCADGLIAYRKLKVERFQHLADTYAMEALNNTDTSERSWLEGVSEGLRTAAAELDTEKVTA